MQLALIFGIVIAAGAVIFALQNNIPVTVTLGLWGFDGSLALLLLLALGLGVLVASVAHEISSACWSPVWFRRPP